MPTFLKSAAIAAIACAIIAGTAEAGQRCCCRRTKAVTTSVDPCPPSPCDPSPCDPSPCDPTPVDPCDSVTPVPSGVIPSDGGAVVQDQPMQDPSAFNVTPPNPRGRPSDRLTVIVPDFGRVETAGAGGGSASRVPRQGGSVRIFNRSRGNR